MQAAAAPMIQPLALELPYAAGMTLKRKKKKKSTNNKTEKLDFLKNFCASKNIIESKKCEKIFANDVYDMRLVSES